MPQQSLIERQAEAEEAALADEVQFVIDGLKSSGTGDVFMLAALATCTAKKKRSMLSRAGVYKDLLHAVTSVQWPAPPRKPPNRAGQTTGATKGTPAQLACACLLLSHTGSEQYSRLLEDDHARELTQALTGLLRVRAYTPATVSQDYCTALEGARASCRFFRFIPKQFSFSAQAVALVAARMAIENESLSSTALKDAAVAHGLLAQLAAVLAENMAVLTGREAPSFTPRTNACMWYANMALAALERLTAAHPASCSALARLRIRYGGDPSVAPTAVALQAVRFARTEGLRANKAAMLGVGTAMRLLMNVTHNPDGHMRGVESLEEVATLLAMLGSQGGSQAGPKHPAAGPACSERLPDTQDLLHGLDPDLLGEEDPGAGASGEVELTADAAALAQHEDVVTSALCVLVNMAERDPVAARELAFLEYSAATERFAATDGAVARGNEEEAGAAGRSGGKCSA